MADYTNPASLVETDWIEQQGDSQEVAILEVDEDTTAYEKGHIPNAISIDWANDLHDLPRREFVTSEQLAKLLGEKGVSSDQTIVLYSGNNNWFAAYAYWLFKYRGVENVKLLNGGRKKWELESRLLTQDEPNRSATTFTIGQEKPELRILRDEVITRTQSPGAWVDVRSPEEFRGELLAPPHLPQEQAQVPGHIPGASNITWSKAVNEDGTFKSADELKELYAAEGITSDKEVVTYCRIGERSSHSWFVLKELLGFENVRNYDGSWTEYGSLVGVGIEK
ncbi:MAG: thiosulfate/3-mercaptopyruvate sulfurtransferase [Actinomycetota bacterium]|jgi:thiosulfate/3-mercaptopyruvate sulfurtransferase|nr:thiosulfate/3-mercaptopyruvate sulfurtransferase [Actinomycetota bacterium]